MLLNISTIGSIASARQARNARVSMDLNATVEVLRQVWAVLEPYIRAERVRRGTTFLEFFENAAAVASEVDPRDLYDRLNLRTI